MLGSELERDVESQEYDTCMNDAAVILSRQ